MTRTLLTFAAEFMTLLSFWAVCLLYLCVFTA